MANIGRGYGGWGTLWGTSTKGMGPIWNSCSGLSSLHDGSGVLELKVKLLEDVNTGAEMNRIACGSVRCIYKDCKRIAFEKIQAL